MIIDFMAYKLTGKEMSPEEYAEVVQRAMDNKDLWQHRPVSDASIATPKSYKEDHNGYFKNSK